MKRSQKGVTIQILTIGLILFLYSSISWFEVCASSINDNLDWLNMSPSIAPPAMFAAEMTYDIESDRIILFSGALSPYVVDNGTWAYDYNTNTWENITPITKPGGRGGGIMVYDEESDRVILFGGVRRYYDPPEAHIDWGDTWAFDFNSNTWENMTPDFSPRSRSIHNMAYDSESDRVILYGGFWGDPSAVGGRRALGDTWAYDYNSNTWTNMSPVLSPGPLYAFGLAYDSESDRVVLYGGKFKSNGFTSLKHETWAYDYNSNNWIEMNPPGSARGNRNRFQMVYHVKWDRILLFGGDSEASAYDDTWVYDYNKDNWTELEPVNRPSSRIYSDLAYDVESDKVILFGGSDLNNNNFNETWALISTPKQTTSKLTTPTPGWNVLLGLLALIPIFLWRYWKKKL
ncbi:MAG: kelch repeat-containing protein [Candidatus Hodarchaeota archaeon]